jgi:hypothetical protein
MRKLIITLLVCMGVGSYVKANDFKIQGFPNGASVSMPYGQQLTFTADVPPNIKNPSWIVKGDIAIVSGANSETVVIVCTGYGKGVLELRGKVNMGYWNCGDSLNADFTAYGTTVELYKSFCSTDSIAGSSIISVGNTYVYSVSPVFARNENARIGFDTYDWIIPSEFHVMYYSHDKSSVSVRVNAMPTTPFGVRVGQFATCTLQKSFIAGAEMPEILSAPADKCIPATTRFVGFKIKTDPRFTYEWEVTNASWLPRRITTSTTDSLSVDIGNTGAGTVVLRTIFPGDTLVQSFSIFRPIDKNFSKIVGGECVYSGTEQIYSIYPAPNEAIEWTVPTTWAKDNVNRYSSTSIMWVPSDALGGTIVASSKECPTSSIDLEVKIQATPPSAITGDSCFVKGVEKTFSILPSANAQGYIWTFPAGWTHNGASTSSIKATPTTNSVLGNVVVHVKGCSSIMDSAVFAIKGFMPEKATVIDRADGRTCINYNMTDTIKFSTPNQGAGYTYSWTAGSGFSIISDSTLREITVASTSAISAKNITVRIVSEGCGASEPLQRTNTITGHGQAPVSIGLVTTPANQIFITNVAGDTIGRNLNTNRATAGNTYRWEFKGEMTNVVSSIMPFEYSRGGGILVAYVRNTANGCTTKSGNWNTAQIIPAGFTPSNAPLFSPMSAPLQEEPVIQKDEPSVAIYPNPTSGDITIYPKNYNEAYLGIQIRNSMGALVRQLTVAVDTNTSVNLSDLQNGVYIVSVIGANNTVHSTQQIQVSK